PRRTRFRHEPGAGGEPREARRGDRGRLLRPAGRGPARAARRGGRARRAGPDPRRGVRVGTDPQPGAADRGRARDTGTRAAARPAAAVLRPGGARGHEDRARRAADPRRGRGGHPRLARGGGRAVIGTRLRARDLIELVLGDTFSSWDEPVDLTGIDPDYAAQLAAARERAGTDEAVITGAGTIDGVGVAVIAGEFEFLGGSIGRATARRIVAAVRRATRERLPLLVATCSGGTRMQEGTPAFVEMISISKAIVEHKAAGLPYLVYLRNPTTGGVYASWGSLGHVTVAEPGALIGFLGPRSVEALTGKPFPSGVQRAEHLVAKGVIDGVVASEDLAGVTRRVVRLLTPHPAPARAADPPPPPPRRTTSTWESVLLTRRPDRPGVREL